MCRIIYLPHAYVPRCRCHARDTSAHRRATMDHGRQLPHSFTTAAHQYPALHRPASPTSGQGCGNVRPEESLIDPCRRQRRRKFPHLHAPPPHYQHHPHETKERSAGGNVHTSTPHNTGVTHMRPKCAVQAETSTLPHPTLPVSPTSDQRAQCRRQRPHFHPPHYRCHPHQTNERSAGGNVHTSTPTLPVSPTSDQRAQCRRKRPHFHPHTTGATHIRPTSAVQAATSTLPPPTLPAFTHIRPKSAVQAATHPPCARLAGWGP